MSDELLLTEKDLPWLYDFTVTKGNIDSVLEAQLAKVKQHYEQKLRIKNPFEKKLPVNSTAGEGAYFRGCYDGFERLRRELKK